MPGVGDAMQQLRTILLYSAMLVAGVFALQWLEYRYVARAISGPWFAGVVAIVFAGVGGVVALAVLRKRQGTGFERNEQGLKALGITDREYVVLEALAAGQTNKEIARTLNVSPNTVKTHVARLFEKLEVGRRTAAVQRARSLRLIP